MLKQNTWTDIINDAFLEKYKLPCNFIYKQSIVSSDTTRSKYFIKFYATCKDKGCKLFGSVDKQPQPGQPLLLKVLANDTRSQELQHFTKRPLKGTKREAVGKQLSTDLACNWRRNNVSGSILCSNKMCINAQKDLSSPTKILNFSEGFNRMNTALNKYIQPITYLCTEDNCNGTLTSTRFLQQHLFIETEVYADSRLFSLNEFPTELCLNGDR